MTNQEPADLPAGEVCPGPPEAPYAALGAWPHHWQPVTVSTAGPIQEAEPAVSVLEVCPICRQWRQIDYTRIDPSPRLPG